MRRVQIGDLMETHYANFKASLGDLRECSNLEEIFQKLRAGSTILDKALYKGEELHRPQRKIMKEVLEIIAQQKQSSDPSDASSQVCFSCWLGNSGTLVEVVGSRDTQDPFICHKCREQRYGVRYTQKSSQSSTISADNADDVVLLEDPVPQELNVLHSCDAT